MPPRLRKTLARGPSSSREKRPRRSPSPPPPNPLPWPFRDNAHKARYELICNRELIPSKCMDEFTIDHLGMKEEVHEYIQRLGWEHLAFNHVSTYKEITLEILSSISSTFIPYNDTREVTIHFRCMGEEYHISLDDFNAIFGLSKDGITWFPPDGFSTELAWNELTSLTEYNASKSKSTKLKSFAQRYIHRFMAHSLFGRGESTGVVNKTELFFLYAMHSGWKVNTGAWILRHLLHVAKQSTGKICVGGLLTIIAHSFGFIPIDGVHTLIQGNPTIDLDTLVKMKMCKCTGGGLYRLIDEHGQAIYQDNMGGFEQTTSGFEQTAAMGEQQFMGEQQDMGEQPEYMGEQQYMGTQQETEQHHPQQSQDIPSTSHTAWTNDSMMEAILGRFQQMETTFKRFEDRLDERMDRLEERMDRLERRE